MARSSSWWKVPVAVMVLGALLGLPFVVRAVRSVGGIATADAHPTPVELREDLDPGRYVVFERTGTTRRVGPVTATDQGAPTLSIESVAVRGPDGERVPLSYDRANETITQNSAIFTGVLVFDVEHRGTYVISVEGGGRQVLVARSIGSTFRDLGRPFLLAVAGGLLFLAGGLVLLVLGLRRRSSDGPPSAPTPPNPTPPPVTPPAGWYQEPSGGAGRRYWDGSEWTEHVAP